MTLCAACAAATEGFTNASSVAADFDAIDAKKFPLWAQKAASWKAQASKIKEVDFIGKTERIVIAEGKEGAEFRDEREGFYNAHPTSLLLDDGKTIFCVWNIGHGGNAGPVAKSEDGGKTWKRVDSIMPPCYRVMRNCPSIYKIRDAGGKTFLQVFAMGTRRLPGLEAPTEKFYKGYMPRVVSEDLGKTWRKLPPLSPERAGEMFTCVMAFTSMVELKDGTTLGVFHRGNAKNEDKELRVLQTATADGGITWSEPRLLAAPEDVGGGFPCEPYIFRSPDGSELCCIMRENTRKNGTSLMMFSSDEGKTWSKPVDTPWALTGDRHQGIVLPDGRLFIVFRDQVPCARKGLRFGAWVGTFADLKNGGAGQYRVILSRSRSFRKSGMGADGYYPSIHLLPDGTIAAITYESIEGGKGCSVVCHRFKMSDIENAAK